MKRAFTTNWHIYTVCLPSILAEPKDKQDTNEKAFAFEKSRPCNPIFEKLLLEAVDEELSSLGDSVKQAFYFYLEKEFNVNRLDIPHKIEEFVNAIEEIFGPGAKLIEIEIMKRFYKKVEPVFKYFPEKNELQFTDYMEAARLSLSRSNSFKSQST